MNLFKLHWNNNYIKESLLISLLIVFSVSILFLFTGLRLTKFLLQSGPLLSFVLISYFVNLNFQSLSKHKLDDVFYQNVYEAIKRFINYGILISFISMFIFRNFWFEAGGHPPLSLGMVFPLFILGAILVSFIICELIAFGFYIKYKQYNQLSSKDVILNICFAALQILKYTFIIILVYLIIFFFFVYIYLNLFPI